jgi:2-keto-4-pentenoate hydratase/2-oxohepta-3-ene-1,7-dioic acid hydratase in catechol pathway
MFDTFTPMGPALLTPDEIHAPDQLEMITKINGEIVQHGCTAVMFFSVETLISMISELTTLLPGDVILTGSPKTMDGQQNLAIAVRPGDVIEASIEKIGVLRNTAVAEEAGAREAGAREAEL